MSFQAAARLDDLWQGEMLGVVVGGRKVLLTNCDQTVRAYEDRCVHQAFELSRGRLDGCVLTCPAHEWQYDVRTGQGVNPATVHLTSLPVRIDAGTIYVDVDTTGAA